MVNRISTFTPNSLLLRSRDLNTRSSAEDIANVEKAHMALAKLRMLQPFLNSNLRIMLGILNRQLTVFARQHREQVSEFNPSGSSNFTEMRSLSDVEIEYLQEAIKTPKTLANELANFVFYIEDAPTECLCLSIIELQKVGIDMSDWNFKDSKSVRTYNYSTTAIYNC